jgi:hypothetical protein
MQTLLCNRRQRKRSPDQAVFNQGTVDLTAQYFALVSEQNTESDG